MVEDLKLLPLLLKAHCQYSQKLQSDPGVLGRMVNSPAMQFYSLLNVLAAGDMPPVEGNRRK